MVKTINVRISDQLYADVNRVLSRSAFSLSWLIRLYLCRLCDYFDTLPDVRDLTDDIDLFLKTNDIVNNDIDNN